MTINLFRMAVTRSLVLALLNAALLRSGSATQAVALLARSAAAEERLPHFSKKDDKNGSVFIADKTAPRQTYGARRASFKRVQKRRRENRRI